MTDPADGYLERVRLHDILHDVCLSEPSQVQHSTSVDLGKSHGGILQEFEDSSDVPWFEVFQL